MIGRTRRLTHQRVFTDPKTFVSGENAFGNGDGVLFYPAFSPYFPEESFGRTDVFTSVRLKNIRRGQQDYEILKMVERKVGRQVVTELVRGVVQKAMSEVSMDEPVQWSVKGDDYLQVRQQLLGILEQY